MNLSFKSIRKGVKGLAVSETQYLRKWHSFCDSWARQQQNPLVVSGYGDGDTWSSSKANCLLDDIKTKLEMGDDESLLDAGCGSGFILKELHSHFSKVVALDFSTEMLSHVKRSKIKNSELINGELAKLPFKDDCFNRVLCYFVFTNLPSLTYAKRVVEELIRVTRPGGLILIGQVPNSHTKERWLSKTIGQRSKMMQSLDSIIKRLRTKLARLPDSACELQEIYKFYEPSFFEELLDSFKNVKYEILDSFNPLYDRFEGEKATANYRIDVKITISSGDRRESRTK